MQTNFAILLTAWCLLLANTSVVKAEAKPIIYWVSPTWHGYVSTKNGGLYTELMQLVWSNQKIRVEWQETPWKRALDMVQKGQADVTGASKASDDYYQSSYPILISQEVVLSRSGTFNDWRGAVSLRGKHGIWYAKYLDTLSPEISNHFVGTEFSDRKRALQVFLDPKRNIDFYFDNREQIELTAQELGITLDPNAYSYQLLMEVPLYMNFTKNQRGKALRDRFDLGIKTAYCSGELAKLYQHYKHVLPNKDIDCSGHSD